MKGKRIILFLIGLLFFWLVPGFTKSHCMAAQTIYNSPYVSFSPDRRAWTTNAGNQDVRWYPKETTVTTGIASNLQGLSTGEHYYSIKRQGSVPVGCWKVQWREGKCIHNIYPEAGNYHRISYGTTTCKKRHYSGWVAYCADCHGPVMESHVYMAAETARSIDYLDMGKGMDYFYLCPFCRNLEQGVSMDYHLCRAVSPNRYKVEYMPNFTGQSYGAQGGYMPGSIHMYGNADNYEGEPVTPITQLTLNRYYRTGYRFVGWNTSPDGSGIFYADGALVYNLTDQNWSNTGESEEGIVPLYAQWVRVTGELHIDPAGGDYHGNSRVMVVKGEYNSTYDLSKGGITPPAGHKVSFRCNGGTPVGDVRGTMVFTEWQRKAPFLGDLRGSVYTFLSPDGTADTVTACYEAQAIVLPGTARNGFSFGGWYYDEAFTKPAGGAGDQIVPGTDLVLYAQWIDLKLYAVEDYSSYQGTGAVDLSWTQSDAKQKVYRIYQKTDTTDWVRINTATDLSNENDIRHSFAYNGTVQKYTIPYTGIYQVTAYGAQGTGYSSKTGGKGGMVRGKFWLEKGDVISVKTGGSNGYGGGGKGTVYGGGGGMTIVSGNRTGTLMIGGGGGGATIALSGGPGGSNAGVTDESSTSGIRGSKGMAGGGGGYQGGLSGEYVVHNHTQDCYQEVQDQVAAGNAFYAAYGTPQYDGTGSYPVNMTSGNDFTTIGSHKVKDWSSLAFYLGEKKRIKTPYSGSLKFTATYDGAGAQNDMFRILSGVYLVHKDGRVTSKNYKPYELALKLQKTEKVTVTNCAPSGKVGSTTVTRKTYQFSSDWCKGVYIYSPAVTWTQNGEYYGYPAEVVWRCDYTIPISEDVKEAYLYQRGQFNTDGWIAHSIRNVSYEYDVSILTCGYEEGQLISSKPAYGGSSYINEGEAISFRMLKGQKTGDGEAGLESAMIGFVESHELKDVKAPDLAPPDKIEDATVMIQPLDSVKVQVSWTPPEDRGTDYYHMAETYLRGSTEKLCTSNITKSTLTSGLLGYYFRVDSRGNTTVNQNDSFINKPEIGIQIRNSVQYLHVAAVDVAGNIGETTHIRLDPKKINWNLYTRKLKVREGNHVFCAGGDTYYVRSDGETPFALEFGAYMDGEASEDYQMNYAIYQSLCQDGSGRNGENTFYIPRFPMGSPVREVPVSGQTYSVTGSPCLDQYPYSVIRRNGNGGELEAVQMFTMKQIFDGRSMLIVPRCGAEMTGGDGSCVKYSDLTGDYGNGVTLIGDGTGPVIHGMEGVPEGEAAEEKAVTLLVTASDFGSGVKDFYVKVSNLSQYSQRIFRPVNGVIKIVISEEDALFCGDFRITAYASDRVGNETKLEKEVNRFSLQARITRMLEPHNPIFKPGESGIITVTTKGYADRIVIEFPQELKKSEEERILHFDYSEDPDYVKQTSVSFMVPLKMSDNRAYSIKVLAYKGEKLLQESPMLTVVVDNGTILDEIRTRLR